MLTFSELLDGLSRFEGSVVDVQIAIDSTSVPLAAMTGVAGSLSLLPGIAPEGGDFAEFGVAFLPVRDAADVEQESYSGIRFAARQYVDGAIVQNGDCVVIRLTGGVVIDVSLA